jgi:plastocyanin
MKSSAAGIALLATLFLSQGCSSTTKTEEKSESQRQVQSLPEKTSQTKQPQSNSSTSENKNTEEKKEKLQASSQPQNNSSNTQGKLAIPEKITPNKPVAVKVQPPATVAKANSNDASKPNQMQMVVVSNDLRFFDLVQASYKNNQNIEVKPKFPAPGEYTVFSDFNSTGAKEQLSVEKVTIPGEVPFPTELESYSKTKTFADTKIDLKLSEPDIKAGKKVTLKFDLKQAKNNKPIKDLKPNLGKKANLVVIKSSSSLGETDYIDTETIQKSPNNQIHFTTKFPQPGTYKLWLQFNRNGKVKTADFWVTVNS